MLGWIIGAVAATYVCSKISEHNSKKSNDNVYYVPCSNYQEDHYKVTFENHLSLLRDYNKVNNFAKKRGYRGAPDFFFYLGEYHDERFNHFGRFLDKVRHIRNDIAHEGVEYEIDDRFLEKLEACVAICNEYSRLGYGERLYLR